LSFKGPTYGHCIKHGGCEKLGLEPLINEKHISCRSISVVKKDLKLNMVSSTISYFKKKDEAYRQLLYAFVKRMERRNRKARKMLGWKDGSVR